MRGDSESVVPAALLSRVRELMAHPIRPNAWPENLRLGNDVRLVSVSNGAEMVTLEIADARGVNTPHANLLTLTRARANLEDRFPNDPALARFAAIWLRPNCYAEVEVTRHDRARRTDALHAADNYEAGQTVARAGQVVDEKILAALKALAEKTAPGRLARQIAAEQARSAEIRWRNQWLAVALGVLALISAIAIWRLAQRRKITSMLPAKTASDAAGAVVSCPACDQTIVVGSEVESWQQRALAAEQTAGQARVAIRAGVLRQFARLFRERLVRGLISQRGELLNAQHSAATELAELARRLDELHAPLQERLRAYEQRVTDLERALAVKGAENRELIKAEIQVTRRQLETERAGNRAMLN